MYNYNRMKDYIIRKIKSKRDDKYTYQYFDKTFRIPNAPVLEL